MVERDKSRDERDKNYCEHDKTATEREHFLIIKL
jgi:hypothetical protein